MPFSWIDILIALPLLYGLIIGIRRGLITELLAIAAVVVAFIGARLWGPAVVPWVSNALAAVHLNAPQQVAVCIAYACLFALIAIVLNLIGKWLTHFFEAIHIGWVNHLLGAVFGVIKWGIIVLVLVFIVGQLDSLFGLLPDQWKADSRLWEPALKSANYCWQYIQNAI